MKQDKSILVIDDEDSICLAFKRFFEKRGWSVDTAASAEEGMSKYLHRRPLAVFLDVRLPDRSGLDLLEQLERHGARVVVITAYGGLDTVVIAIQGKAYDYLAKPLDLDRTLAVAERIYRSAAAEDPDSQGAPGEPGILIGKSTAMQEVYKLIARAASTHSPVLLEGETGTGKELVAKAIHQFSSRKNGPFVTINCGAIPENLIESELFGHVRGAFTGAGSDRAGRFESARHGTLLLDEIGELPLPSQVKLLRVLDTGSVDRVGSSRPIELDVRVIAATNRNLREEIERGGFRKDLFYRLAVVSIALPPLRFRAEDIPLLAFHFLAVNTCSDVPAGALSPSALQSLMNHEWPGNVRELKNAIEHALAVAPDRPIAAEDLPQAVRRGNAEAGAGESPLRSMIVDSIRRMDDRQEGRYRRLLAIAERAMIEYALERFRGNQSEAAGYLGVHRNTLRNKMRELNMTGQE